MYDLCDNGMRNHHDMAVRCSEPDTTLKRVLDLLRVPAVVWALTWQTDSLAVGLLHHRS